MDNIDYFRYRIIKRHGCIIHIPIDPDKYRFFGLGLEYVRHEIYKNLKLGLSYANFKMFINEPPF